MDTAVLEDEKLWTDFINNGRMSDDEVVASDVPPRYLFISNSLMSFFCSPSVSRRWVSALLLVATLRAFIET